MIGLDIRKVQDTLPLIVCIINILILRAVVKLLMLFTEIRYIGAQLLYVGPYPLIFFFLGYTIQAEHRIAGSSADPNRIGVIAAAAGILNIKRSSAFLDRKSTRLNSSHIA